jgi:hypothetical protein
MDVSKLRSISNNYADVRLLSLRDWKDAGTIVPRDVGGPYMVVQEGYDPQDFKMRYDEFVLGRSGNWITVAVLLKLPREVRRNEYIFGTASEVIHLLQNLHGQAEVITSSAEANALSTAAASEPDDLKAAFEQAKHQAGG